MTRFSRLFASIAATAIIGTAMAATPFAAMAQNAGVLSAANAAPPSFVEGAAHWSTQTLSGGLRVQPQDGAGHDASATTPLPVYTPATPSVTSGCAITTSSAQCLAAGVAVRHLLIANASTGAIACAFNAAAALNAAGSFTIAAGGSLAFGGTTWLVPTGPLNCIGASAGAATIDAN